MRTLSLVSFPPSSSTIFYPHINPSCIEEQAKLIMGRSAEDGGDEAAKNVASSGLRQAPASAGSEEETHPVVAAGTKKAPLSAASGDTNQKATPSGVSQAPPSSQQADEDEAKARAGRLIASEAANSPRSHRQQRSHPPPVEEESVSAASSSVNAVGAFAVGGRRREGQDDAYTLTSPQEQSVELPQQRPSMTREVLPIAAELAPSEEDTQRRMAQADVPVVTAEPAPSIEPTAPKPPTEEESTDENRTGWFSQKRNKFISFLILLLVVGIVVAVVLLVSGGDDGQGSLADDAESTRQGNSSGETVETPTPTVSPTISPAPTMLFDRLFGLISTYTEDSVLQNSSTPQFQAFQWIVGDAESGEDWTDDITLERYALATLFFATGGFRWSSVSNFLLQESYCEWDRIDCANDGITSLSLPSENLSGTMPPELGLLTSLKSLNLSNNPLTGSIPSEIGFLTDLEVMDISVKDGSFDDTSNFGGRALRRRLEDAPPSSTSLTGPIPSEIGLISSLLSLDISNNSLSGNIPSEIGLLENVRTIALKNNRLDGAIPIQFGFLANLEELSLEKNLLTGGVPNSLCSASFASIESLSSDCLAETTGDKPSEVVCKCCNVCCDVNDVCQSFDVTAFPSSAPSTSFPSSSPSRSPTPYPTISPSVSPSFAPSMSPSANPTPSGTPEPTVKPTLFPSQRPTMVPSSLPSRKPTNSPTIRSSIPPTFSCRIDENSCIGNRACNGASDLCTQAGSCLGRNTCRSALDLSVSEGSCVGTSACQEATGIISTNSCTEENSCANFDGISIGSNSCNCVECCSCYGTGELPAIIPSNSCNIRGECCSTRSPTASPTPSPTRELYNAALAEMLAFAQTKSTPSSLQDLTSPQYKAVEWLAQEKVDIGSSWDGYELLQRYVLRVLYHSTAGENWGGPFLFDADTTWFGVSSVCNWGSINAKCNGDNGQGVDYIDFYNCNLQGTIPDELGLLTALTFLTLAYNQLESTIPTELGQLSALIELDLFSNQLTSSIPTQLGQLTALRRLYLSNNKLTSTIPSHFGDLNALALLNLDDNQITGTIPLALTQMTDLNNLALHNNNLTGQVPSAFCAAPFPSWRADGPYGNMLWADCITQVQCDCCDACYNESGNRLCWNGNRYTSNAC